MGCCGGGGFGRTGGGFGRGLFRGGRMQGGPEVMQGGAPMEELDTEKILKARLARGEITVEEYRQLRDALNETPS